MQPLSLEEEQQIIRRCKAGDGQAFALLYEAYQARAYGAALLLCSDPSVAADAVQEAFVRVFLAVTRLRAGAPFRPWFFRILTNETLRLARRRNRIWRPFAHPSLDVAHLPAPDAGVLDRERDTEVRRAVLRLPEVERAAVVLRYYVGLSEEESARSLGVPTGTIKSRVHRAKERLRQSLVQFTSG